MIKKYERRRANRCHFNYSIWTKLALGKCIVNVVVYADESGTHDPSAKQPGTRVAAFGGYIGFADDWIKFNGEWQAALDKYVLKHFHFSEYANKRQCLKKESPYFGWSDKKRHDCLFEFARLAGKHSLTPIAGVFRTEKFQHDDLLKSQLAEMGLSIAAINSAHLMYIGLLNEFFTAVRENLAAIRPGFMEDISFIFDRKEGDDYWVLACNSVFERFRRTDHRFRNWMPADKKKELPLQAADMFVYRARQLRDNQEKSKADHVLNPLDYELWGGQEKLAEFMRIAQSNETRKQNQRRI